MGTMGTGHSSLRWPVGGFLRCACRGAYTLSTPVMTGRPYSLPTWMVGSSRPTTPYDGRQRPRACTQGGGTASAQPPAWA